MNNAIDLIDVAIHSSLCDHLTGDPLRFRIFFRISGVDSVYGGGDDQPVRAHILRQQGGYGSQDQGGGYGQRPQRPAPAPQQSAPPMDDFADDDIPF